MLKERLDRVEERIHAAAGRAGRSRSDITLIAVTKKFPAAIVREAYYLGLRVFGENYVQEFEDKRPQLEGLGEAQFHLIGHLQSNKARIAAEIFQTIGDRRLRQASRRRLDGMGHQLDVMIEVEAFRGKRASKAGAAPEELPELIEDIRGCPNLKLTGLMTMPPWNDDPEVTRPYFRRLAALAREHELAKVSMGMSHDLEAAIEERAPPTFASARRCSDPRLKPA